MRGLFHFNIHNPSWFLSTLKHILFLHNISMTSITILKGGIEWCQESMKKMLIKFHYHGASAWKLSYKITLRSITSIYQVGVRGVVEETLKGDLLFEKKNLGTYLTGTWWHTVNLTSFKQLAVPKYHLTQIGKSIVWSNKQAATTSLLWLVMTRCGDTFVFFGVLHLLK